MTGARAGCTQGHDVDGLPGVRVRRPGRGRRGRLAVRDVWTPVRRGLAGAAGMMHGSGYTRQPERHGRTRSRVQHQDPKHGPPPPGNV